MLILLYVVLIVYYLAINAFGVIILKYQKDTKNSDCQKEHPTVSDGKLLLVGLLGGALGIFTMSLIQKYRLKSMLTIVIMPVLISVYVCLIYLIASGGITFLPR
jgi:uncharacterized membrane protein YsdA (DUF1294 family)